VGSWAAHKGRVTAVLLLPGEKEALSGGADGAVRIHDLVTRRSVASLELPANARLPVTFLALSPNGQRIATLHGSKESSAICVWDRENGKLLFSLLDRRESVLQVAFSADERFLIATDYKGRMAAWDLDTRRPVKADGQFRRSVELARIGIHSAGTVSSAAGRTLRADTSYPIKSSLGSDLGLVGLLAEAVGHAMSKQPWERDYSRPFHSIQLMNQRGAVVESWSGRPTASSVVLLFPDARWALVGDEQGLLHFWRLPNRQEPKSRNAPPPQRPSGK
jgi:hypothetical protein